MTMVSDAQLVRAAAGELAKKPARFPERQTLTTRDGMSISALRWPGEGVPLVAFHGGFESAHIWDLVALLSQRPIVALDLPGCGRSDRLDQGTYWPGDIGEMVLDILQQALAEPATFVGLSYGGLVALSVAGLAPQMCSNLMLLDVLPSVHAEQSARVVQILKSAQPALNREDVISQWAGLHPPRSRRYLTALVDSLYAFDPMASICADVSAHRWEPVSANISEMWDVIRELGPVTLLAGAHSNVVSGSDVEQFLQECPNGVVRVIPRSGHHIPLHNPHEIVLSLKG